MAGKKIPLAQKLTSKLRLDPKSDCLIFHGSCNRKGYGMISNGRGSHIKAHRAAWEIANERPVPDGFMVLHRCDNPPCCNPDHLWLGTALDNARDRVAKGRPSNATGAAPREKHPRAKLTGVNVRAIRVDPRRYKAIAADFGIHPRYVGKLKAGTAWATLD